MAKKNKGEKEPQYYTSATNSLVLNYNVYYFSAIQRIAFSLGLWIIGGLVGLVFYGGLFSSEGKPTFATYIADIAVFLIVGFFARKSFLPVIREFLRKRRINKLKLQFKDFLDSLSNSLSGGMNVVDSISNAYNDLLMQYSADAYIVKEVNEMIVGINNNISIEDLIKDFGIRSGIQDVANFAIVFETAYRTGGNMKDIIRRTADIISEKTIISAEIETKLTSNKTQISVMNIVPVGIVLMLRLSSTDFAESFASPIGVIAMTIGVAIFVASYKIGQKIMDVKG